MVSSRMRPDRAVVAAGAKLLQGLADLVEVEVAVDPQVLR